MNIIKLISLSLFISLPGMFVNAQKNYTAKQDLELEIQGEKGTNGAGVAWNPANHIYYVSIAGNTEFPLEVFSEKGQNLYSGKTCFDSRGIWYNSKTGKLEGNGYDDSGIWEFTMDSKAYPTNCTNVIRGVKNADNPQSTATYNSEKDLIMYYSNGLVYTFKRNGGKKSKTIKLADPSLSWSAFNSTSMIYTGRKGEEIGLLNYSNQTVYLFSLKGSLSAKVQLPSDALSNELFCFAFANNRIWIYDLDERIWTGYLIE